MFENRGDVFFPERNIQLWLKEISNWETTVGGGLKTCYICCFIFCP